jgi:hypothetical protein
MIWSAGATDHGFLPFRTASDGDGELFVLVIVGQWRR